MYPSRTMKLNSSNYHSQEANLHFMSVSQWKDFMDCEAKALAKLNGAYQEDRKAFQLGQYLHAWNEGVLEQYQEENRALIFQKNGARYKDYRKADMAIEALMTDPFAMKALRGEKEVIMTGELFGVMWKIRIDNLHQKRFSDLKYVRDFKPLWDSKDQCRKSFIEYWGYHTQMAVYQKVIEQNTGKVLEPLIVAVTKEEIPDKNVYWGFEEWEMAQALAYVEQTLQRVLDVKEGLEQPRRCGNCAYCRATKVLDKGVKWNEI